MAWIRVVNWRKFQHYKDRNPPWIKVHREQILDDRAYRGLSDSAQALLIDLWMLASEHDGKVKDDLRDLEFRLRRPRDEMAIALQRLADAGLVQLSASGASDLLQDASNPETGASMDMLATRLQGAPQRRGEERREEENGGPPELREAKAAMRRVLSGEEPPAPRLRKP